METSYRDVLDRVRERFRLNFPNARKALILEQLRGTFGLEGNSPNPVRQVEALGRYSAEEGVCVKYMYCSRGHSQSIHLGEACGQRHNTSKKNTQYWNSLHGMQKSNHPRFRPGPLNRPRQRHILPSQLLLPSVPRPPNLRIKRPYRMETHRQRHPPTNTTESRTKRHET